MIEIQNLVKHFGTLKVLDGISFRLEKGQVLAVIGPSGTGKSTLLRCINFLERPNQGIIHIGDTQVNAAKASRKEILALRKHTSMVFQNYNLFKNKTAIQNVMEPMVAVQGMSAQEAEKRALEILQLIGLSDKRDSYPSRLSGGQQQRVGIGRAMAVNPDVILFDEPTSSLDSELVGEVLEVIRNLAKQHRTMIITTHEMNFARSVADRVIFLSDGKIAEEGTPEEVFDHPQQERTRQFLRKFSAN